MELLEQWREASTMLKVFKEKELRLRKELIADVGHDEHDTGTNKYDMDNGTLVVTQGVKLFLDEAELDMHIQELSDEEKAAVTWKPYLSKKLYDSLDPMCVLKMHVVTATPTLPSVKFKKDE